MLSSYKASISFLQEHRLAVGKDHKSIVATTRSEVLHLNRLFRTEPLDIDDPSARAAITAVIQHLRADMSGIFSDVDRQQLIETAASRLSSQSDTVSGHGSQKSQTHLTSHRYLTSSQWDYIMDETHSLKAKQTFLSKVWIGWGLRYPSGPTFRSGLALLAVASKLAEHAPDKMHAYLLEFQSEFRKLRELYPGDATMKVFPASPTDFKTMYPSMLDEPVECRLDTSKILELSHPRAIPVKGTNASLTGSHGPSTRSSSSASTPAMPSPASASSDLFRDLLSYALGRAPAPSHPPPVPRPSVGTPGKAARRCALPQSPAVLAITDATQPSDEDPQSTPPRQPPMPAGDAALPAQSSSAEAASLMGPTQPAPASMALDLIAKQTADFINARKSKRAANDDRPMRIIGKSPAPAWATTAPASHTPGKKAKQAKKTAATPAAKPAAKLAATPAAKPSPSNTDIPPVDMNNTVLFGGGKLYNYPKRHCFRVWPRARDRKDKNISYGKAASQEHLRAKWADAIQVIKDDPRPVN